MEAWSAPDGLATQRIGPADRSTAGPGWAGSRCSTSPSKAGLPLGQELLLNRRPVMRVVDVAGDVEVGGAEGPGPLGGVVRRLWMTGTDVGVSLPGAGRVGVGNSPSRRWGEPSGSMQIQRLTASTRPTPLSTLVRRSAEKRPRPLQKVRNATRSP